LSGATEYGFAQDKTRDLIGDGVTVPDNSFGDKNSSDKIPNFGAIPGLPFQSTGRADVRRRRWADHQR